MGLTFKQSKALKESGDARQLREAGKFSEAIKIYTSILKRYPISELYNERGITFSASGQLKNAITDLTDAIKLKGDDADYFVNRGNVYLRLNDYEAAINDYNSAIELEPNFAHAYNGRGYAYGEIGRTIDSFNDFITAIQLGDGYVSPYYNLGVLCFKLEKFEEALHYLDCAYKLRPDDAWTLCILGDVYKSMNDINKAYEKYKKAVEVDNSNLRARQKLAWIMSTNSEDLLRDGEKALVHAKWCCEETDWLDHVCLQTLSAAYAEYGNFSKAIIWQKEAIKQATEEDLNISNIYLDQLMRKIPIRE